MTYRWKTKMQRKISETFSNLCKCNNERCYMCQPIIGKPYRRGVK